jgi:ankyrin repeat protein
MSGLYNPADSVPLLQLPLELLYLVSNQTASQGDVNALVRCNRSLYKSLNVFLYRSNMQGSNGSALMWAAARGRSGTARKMFEACGDIEFPAAYLQDALILATQNCSWGVIKVLIANGTDVNPRGEGFGHVLQAASWKGDIDLVQSLINAGADVNVLAGHYGTALQAAAWNGHRSVSKLLISKGADMNVQGGYYGNALQAASWAGHYDLVKQLISDGAAVNASGGSCGSALQAACWSGNKQVIKGLLQAGADISTRGRESEDAVIVALRRGHVSAVGLLLTWSVQRFISGKLTMLTNKHASWLRRLHLCRPVTFCI